MFLYLLENGVVVASEKYLDIGEHVLVGDVVSAIVKWYYASDQCLRFVQAVYGKPFETNAKRVSYRDL